MPEAVPFNPLRIFKFKLYFMDDGDNPIAGVSKMGALKSKNESIAWRSAAHVKNSASQIPGGTSYEPVTFELGLGLDDGRFETWAFSTSSWKEGQGAFDDAAFRKDLRVDVLDLSGVGKLSYILSSAWVSEYQALPELDANNMNTIGIQSFTVQYEGWSRQT